MTTLSKSLLGALPAVVLAFVLFSGAALATTCDCTNFTDTNATAPTNDANTPLHDGTTAQTKVGGLTNDGLTAIFGSTAKLLLGTNSGWFYDSGDNKTTLVAQQYCIGTDVTTGSNDSCTVSFSAALGSCKLESWIVTNIPPSMYTAPISYNILHADGTQTTYSWDWNNRKYYDVCDKLLDSPGYPLTRTGQSNGGWIATNSDLCAARGGGSNNCDAVGDGPLECYYTRIVCNGVHSSQGTRTLVSAQ